MLAAPEVDEGVIVKENCNRNSLPEARLVSLLNRGFGFLWAVGVLPEHRNPKPDVPILKKHEQNSRFSTFNVLNGNPR
jgi:hypothetical protein